MLVQASPTDSVYNVARHHVGKNHRLILIVNGKRINKTATVESIGSANVYYAWRLETKPKPKPNNKTNIIPIPNTLRELDCSRNNPIIHRLYGAGGPL